MQYLGRTGAYYNVSVELYERRRDAGDREAASFTR